MCWKGDICSALGFCSTGRRIQQPSTRTRHPAMTRWVLSLCGGRGVGTPPVPLSLLTLELPPARLSPESSTTARGTAVPAPPPTAARSSRRHTRRMCASFMKVGAPVLLVCFCCPLWVFPHQEKVWAVGGTRRGGISESVLRPRSFPGRVTSCDHSVVWLKLEVGLGGTL